MAKEADIFFPLLPISNYIEVNEVPEPKPIKSTPKEASEKSLTGKVYGFFQNIGTKIKDTFNHVKNAIFG